MKKTLLNGLALAVLGLGMMPGNAVATPIWDFAVSAPVLWEMFHGSGDNSLNGKETKANAVAGDSGSLNKNIAFSLANGLSSFQTGPTIGSWQWREGFDSKFRKLGGLDFRGALPTVALSSAHVTDDDNTFSFEKEESSVAKPNRRHLGRRESSTSSAFSENVNISDTIDEAAINSESLLSDDLMKVAPVPEPATILLFGTGLAGLAGLFCCKRISK